MTSTNRHKPSFRADLITRRTYNRPKEDGTFETWEETVQRVVDHQKWLWERAKGTPLSKAELQELETLKWMMEERIISTSGRTLWLGGTDIAKKREASQFNCSFQKAATVYDIVDGFWLLLQGCGLGDLPEPGILSGFTRSAEIDVIRSIKQIGDPKGVEDNKVLTYTDLDDKRVYWLTIGDSAEAWAKSVGKLLALKDPVDRIVLDFSQIRAAGERLKGYGWISSGDETFSEALTAICGILNRRVGELLDEIDLIDLINWLGTTLSSRRSAEIMVLDYNNPKALDFAMMKKDHWANGNPQRAQSNNSLLFWQRPSKLELKGIFQMMLEAGGSEPGFINAEAAKRRAPWFMGVNPCAEILLGNKSFCNLVEVDWGKLIHDNGLAYNAINIAARANYRQTCVNLKDGVLSDTWHELNEFLRLCGVGGTGIVKFLDAHKHTVGLRDTLQSFKRCARESANNMADELGLPRPKLVTTVKPSGTLGKIMDTTEGAHKPLGKYIFNNVRFSKNDPLVTLLSNAGYHIFDDPYASDGVLVRLPVAYEDVEFDVVERGDTQVEVNLESAVSQLDRYKLLMDNYVDHNCSITVSYSPDEVPAIVDWLFENWDTYVGVSFILRNDPSKTAEDLGYPYLPQEVVTKEVYDEYVRNLKHVDVYADTSEFEVEDEGCATGACPIK